MNHDRDTLPESLRFRLRALRRDEEPPADLWPGIAARLQPRAAAAPAPRRVAWSGGAALAAALALALGAVLWLQPGSRSEAPAPLAEADRPALAARHGGLVQAEAEYMAREYDAALRELGTRPVPPALTPVLEDLDRNAALIRDALRQTGSPRLLEQLRRTYDRRIELMRRAYI